MATPTELMRRVLDTLKRDAAVARIVKNANGFRVGSYRRLEQTLNVLPMAYVTLPDHYIHSRVAIGGPVAKAANPREVVTYVLNVVCVSRPQGSTLGAQMAAYDLANACMEALYHNITLEDADGGDPLSHDLEIESMGRHMVRAGTEIEGVTLMVHVRTTVDHIRDA